MHECGVIIYTYVYVLLSRHYNHSYKTFPIDLADPTRPNIYKFLYGEAVGLYTYFCASYGLALSTTCGPVPRPQVGIGQSVEDFD